MLFILLLIITLLLKTTLIYIYTDVKNLLFLFNYLLLIIIMIKYI